MTHAYCLFTLVLIHSAASMIMEHDPQYEIEAANFFNDLIIEINRKATEMSSNVTGKLRLIESIKMFNQCFSHNPAQLYSHLRKCLIFEQKILNDPEMSQRNEFMQVQQSIENLMSRVRANAIHSRNLKDKYEQFRCEVNEVAARNEKLDMLATHDSKYIAQIAVERTKLRISLQESQNHLIAMITHFIESLKSLLEITENVQMKVINENLNQWHINQILKVKGIQPSTSIDLDVIQNCFEHLAYVLWETREQMKMLHHQQLNCDQQNLPNFLPELFTKSTNLLEHLITRSFIIEEQPPQMLKTNTR